MVEIGQNTEKSPGELRRLAVLEIRVKDPQLTNGVKNSKGEKNDDNKIL